MVEEMRIEIVESKWGDCVLDENFWDESNAPIVKVKEFSDIRLNESESGGILSDRLIGICSSFLAKCPYTENYALIKCNLNYMNLVDMAALKSYKYFQYLNLSHNNLTDLTPLGCLQHLVHLDASHNKLNSLPDFSPPLYLTYIDLSHNNITYMRNLSEFWSMVHLNLSHNSIEVISGLQNLKYLKHLDLSYNLINCVQNLDHLNIEQLNLEFNCITRCQSLSGGGLDTLPNLRILLLGHNAIFSLNFLQNASYSLRTVDLKYNKVADPLEISNLRCRIDDIDLRGNVCTTWPHYREVLIHSMPTVACIDGCEVTISERVSAVMKFNPPAELLASRTLSKLILLEHLNPPRIDDSVSPYDECDPLLIVLSGPPAVQKTLLGLHIAQKMSDRVKYCRSYTTREFSAEHDELKAYKFVTREEFNEIVRSGAFLTVEELIGDSYGFHAKEIASLRREHKIGITQMDLGASIQLKYRYPNAKLVLVIPKSEEIHRQWIRDKFHIFTWIKDSVENLLALTIEKLPSEHYVESSISKINFVSNLVSEIIEDLDLPTYSNYVRPQATGATATDIIFQSRMMLPRVTKTRKEIMEERRIKFSVDEKSDENAKRVSSKAHLSELKIILDEHMNIIIDDEESKKKSRLTKLLQRRKTFEEKGEVMSASSDESQHHLFDQFKRISEPKYLINLYVEVVMRSRQVYIDKHLKNPGFYSLLVFSDEHECTVNSLAHFISDHMSQTSRKHKNPDIEYRSRVEMPKAVDKVLKQLKRK